MKPLCIFRTLVGPGKLFEKAFQFLGHEAFITDDPQRARDASHLVLPGDAAFGDAMRNLRTAGWDTVIEDHVSTGRPFLGICVGLQLMFATSEEMGQHTGLDLFAGRCRRFPAAERVPQIGWNQISVQQPCAILDGIEEGSFFYFVHSYYVETDKAEESVAVTAASAVAAGTDGRGWPRPMAEQTR